MLRNAVASLIIFSALVVSFTEVYIDFGESYNITQTDLQTHNGNTKGIMDHLKAINVVEGINTLEQGILNLRPPSGSGADLLGGLASVGIGVVKLTLGLITIPYEVMKIMITFYAGEVPGVIAAIITQMIVIYIGFILISLYLRNDV